jgi:1,4-alpha-glucan branching enzyme
MLRKKPVKGANKLSVTFETQHQDAEKIHVAGDFNGWDKAATPMKKRKKDGVWSATVRLETDREYQYRYVVDGERWITDDESDGSQWNEYGERNSVVRT